MQAYKEAIAAGYAEGWVGLGNMMAKHFGGWPEAEYAYREAIARGHTASWMSLGLLLARQTGREDEALAAYEAAIAAGRPERPAEHRPPRGRRRSRPRRAVARWMRGGRQNAGATRRLDAVRAVRSRRCA